MAIGGLETPAAAGPWMRGVAIALAAYFAGFLAFAVLAQRGLVADGAGYFVMILERHAVVSPEISRWTANLLTQWPVLLALWAGVTDLPSLSLLFGFGLFYLSALTLALGWLLLPAGHKALFVLPLLTLLFGWMGSSYGAISQGQVAALWFWPTAFALGRLSLRSWRGTATVLALVLPTILMHEALCLLGPLLAAIAWWRARDEPQPGLRALWRLIGLWLLAGAALAFYFTLIPINARDRAGFIEGLVRLHFLYDAPRRFNPPVVVALVGAAVMALCCGAATLARRYLAIWLPVFGLFLLCCAVSPLVFPDRFAPQLQLDGRSWVVAVPLLLAAALVAVRAGRLAIRPATRPLLAIVIAMTAAAQITWQSAATLRWTAFVADVRRELAGARGYVPYETAFGPGTPGGPTARDILATGWTFPFLSIALAPGGRVATIVGNPLPIFWQAFDPTRPEDLPPAAGIDYTDYVRVLATTR